MTDIDYNIIDYQDCIKESSVKNIEKHFLDIDKFRQSILKSIVNTLDLYKKNEIGEPILLSVLADLKTKVQRKINIVESEIPEIANVEFALFGTLKKGGTILISKDFDSDTEIQSERKKLRSKYKDQLKNNLTLSLGDLLIEIENTVEKIKNIEAYPDIEQWYPQLMDVDEKPDPRLKYFPDQFWDTVGKIRESKELTWEQTYKYVKHEMDELKIPLQYSTFDSFRKLIPDELKGKRFPKKGSNLS